jgi:hypothetical protein
MPVSRRTTALLAGLILAAAAPALAKDAPKGKPEAERPPASPRGDWRTQGVKGPDGAFRYCLSQAAFDTGHTLVLARTPAGALNLAVGVPGARLPAGETWTVSVGVDATPARSKNAMAAQPDLLVVDIGVDPEFEALVADGKRLSIRTANDRVDFALRGAKGALADLKDCVSRKGAGAPAKTELPDNPFPEALTVILAAAGFRQIQPVDLSGIPEKDRSADYAWRMGSLLNGMRERTVPEGSAIKALAAAHTDEVAGRCGAGAKAETGEVEVRRGVSLLTADVACPRAAKPLHVALLYYLTDAHLFTVFFHEAPVEERNAALTARDGIARALRALAAGDDGAAKQRGKPAPVVPPKTE